MHTKKSSVSYYYKLDLFLEVNHHHLVLFNFDIYGRYRKEKKEMDEDFKCSCQNQIIDEWVKGKVIGSGTFGTVNLAMNKVTGSLSVIKSANSKSGIEALKNEADILENLDSPYIVRCIKRNLNSLNGTKNDKEKENFSIFLEYVSGGSLSDIIENFGGKLDKKVIKLYTKKVLLGLKYIHSSKIVHCDLKCKNVLVGSDGEIKLADFGCAKRINNSKRNNKSKSLSSFEESNIRGTPLWMAPEVLKNEGVNFASDIWSLGCLVIEMATGRPPWSEENENNSENNNPMGLMLKIASGNEKPKFPEKFCQEGLNFLGKCFERDPRKRPSADELLNHPFITGENKFSTKYCICSPLSVLDIGKYEEDEYGYVYEYDNCDGLRKRPNIDEGGFCGRKNPFSTRVFSGVEIWKNTMKHNLENNGDNFEFWSPEDWITVRSS